MEWGSKNIHIFINIFSTSQHIFILKIVFESLKYYKH